MKCRPNAQFQWIPLLQRTENICSFFFVYKREPSVQLVSVIWPLPLRLLITFSVITWILINKKKNRHNRTNQKGKRPCLLHSSYSRRLAHTRTQNWTNRSHIQHSQNKKTHLFFFPCQWHQSETTRVRGVRYFMRIGAMNCLPLDSMVKCAFARRKLFSQRARTRTLCARW